MKNTSKGSVA